MTTVVVVFDFSIANRRRFQLVQNKDFLSLGIKNFHCINPGVLLRIIRVGNERSVGQLGTGF